MPDPAGLLIRACLAFQPDGVTLRLIAACAASMLAPDGRCKTLDAAADGYARGEACISLGLSVHATAAAAASALALVLGTAVNQDGRSSSLTAPNGPSQQAVIRLALADAQLPAAALSTLEMHGTGECRFLLSCLHPWYGVGRSSACLCLGFGLILEPVLCHLLALDLLWPGAYLISPAGSLPLSTQKPTMHHAGTSLGDPIEVGAAVAVFGSKPGTAPRPAPLELSAAKSSLGHAEPAAGAAGILRALHRWAGTEDLFSESRSSAQLLGSALD